MATDFGFFERSLTEKRIYRVTRDWERDFIKELAGTGGVDILEDAEDHTLVRVTNLMDPGTPDGARPIEKRFGVELPAEVDEFYRRWDGGVLIYQYILPILPVAMVIEESIAYRKDTDVSLELPWRLLRFCDMGDSNYLALRRRAGREWEVIWADVEVGEMELLFPEDPAYDANIVLDDSFLRWLRRMDETDGWVWGEGVTYSRDGPPCKRVW